MRSPRLLSFLSINRSFSTQRSSGLAQKMPRLNPASQKAIDRLRSYKPPATSYDLVPLSRRAAVLVLLYADSMGDLRVVLTMRAKTLSSYAGQAALPGGRADSVEETPFQTARREAHEEIGLSDIGQALPHPFSVEHLCEFPANLARTELVVRPCVALLHSYDERTSSNADPEVSLIPKLDAREVAAVFTAPFSNFLSMRDEEDWVVAGRGRSGSDDSGAVRPEDWYQGAWTEWHQSNWRMHQFFVPIRPEAVVKPRARTRSEHLKAAISELEEKEKAGEVVRYRVWGMTARMLVDVARVAYDREPAFEHNSHLGDEEMIARLRRMGRLSPIRRSGDVLTREDMEKAAKLS